MRTLSTLCIQPVSECVLDRILDMDMCILGEELPPQQLWTTFGTAMHMAHLYKRPCACEACQIGIFGTISCNCSSMALGCVIGYQQTDPASKELMAGAAIAPN